MPGADVEALLGSVSWRRDGVKHSEELKERAKARDANAVIAVKLFYQVVADKYGMMMVVASGTAVVLEKSDEERKKKIRTESNCGSG